jgi:hypothetical protein
LGMAIVMNRLSRSSIISAHGQHGTWKKIFEYLRPFFPCVVVSREERAGFVLSVCI